MWILDTDHLTLFQNDHPLIKQRINQINSENIAVTVVTFEEQMRGWLNAINQSSQSERVIWAYKGLSDGIKYFNNVKLLDFTQDAYSCYQDLVRQKIRVGTLRFTNCRDRSFSQWYRSYTQSQGFCQNSEFNA